MKVHLIGICGTGMGSLAGLLKAAGHDVRGSDEHVYPPMSTQLAEQGIPVFEGFRPANLDWGPDAVVVGNVCRKDHVEVLAAQERSIPLESFPSLLRELFLAETARSVVVAGTHGKTTTLVAAGARARRGRARSVVPDRRRAAELPAVVAPRRRAPSSSSRATSTTPRSSTRARSSCTTGRSIVLLTSVEFDHADIFADEEAVQGRLPQVRRADPARTGCWWRARPRRARWRSRAAARCQVVTYGRPGSGADWTFEVAARAPGGRTTLDVARRGERVGHRRDEPARHLQPREPGRRDRGRGQPGRRAAGDRAAAARRFLGVRRRQEVRGVARGVTVVDDFAHHPTAIRETVAGAQGTLRPRQADRGVRAALGHQPPQRLPGRVRRRAVGRRRGRAGAALRPREGAGGRAPRRRAAGRRPAPRGRPGARSSRPSTRPSTHLADARRRRATPCVVMSSGDYGGLHDKLLRRAGRSGDAGAPRAQGEDRQPARPGRHRAPGAGAVLAALPGDPGDDDGGAAGRLRRHRARSTTSRCCACWRSRPSGAARASATCWSRRRPTARAPRACGRLYLVTDGAQGYFGEKLGFAAIDRKDVDPAIQATGGPGCPAPQDGPSLRCGRVS